MQSNSIMNILKLVSPRLTTKSLLLGSAFIASFVFAPPYALAALPAGFEVETIASGMKYPTAMTFTNDGRIFVAEKAGVVRVIKNGALVATPVIQLSDVNAYGDRGLIGITVDPNFSKNGYLYLLYTYENTPGTNFAGLKTGRLVRVTVVGDSADESSKVVLVGSVGGTLAAPSCDNYAVTEDCIASDSPSHSVGALRFGPDGMLYVSLGEGAHFDYVDPRSQRAQNVDSLAGKILRISPDGHGLLDNPFANGTTTTNRSKVFALGMRNAYRMNFRPSNGSLYAGDVGWNTWEAVDHIVKGGNYGWPCREAGYINPPQNCDVNPYVSPVYAYNHNGGGASVAAGAFPLVYPVAYANSFFIGDYTQNWIKRVVVDSNDNFVGVQDFMSATDGTQGPVALDCGPDGNIYFISIYTGALKRILYTTGNRQPIAQLSATPTNGLAPLTTAFSAASSTDPDSDPLTFSWDFGDGATSTAVSPSHTYTTNGTYTAVLSVTDGKGGLNTKSIAITVGNRAPTAVVTSPISGSLYRPGDSIQLSGKGLDPEDGTIVAADKLTWTIILHHNTHIHVLQTLTGTNPSFPAPDHAGTDIYTEVVLTVTDSGGLSSSKSVNIYLDNNNGVAGNLILNPGFEDAVDGSPNSPQYWRKGGYGVNATDYTYPVLGEASAKAAQLMVGTFTNGDAKWIHDPVSVTPNTVYVVSGAYKSTALSELLIQNGSGDGTYTYDTLNASMPIAPDWRHFSYPFTTPTNGKTVTAALLLARVGTLTIDNFSITKGTSTPVTDSIPPVVTVTAPQTGAVVSGITVLVSANATDASGIANVKFYVDSTLINLSATSPYTFNWNSTSVADGVHTIVAVARDASGNVATSTGTSIQVQNQSQSVNLITNPSVEILSTDTPGTPQGWTTDQWGTNTTTFTYPVAGFDGAKAMSVSISNFTDGDAKWFFANVPVTAGVEYQYSNYYKSTISSSIVAQYTLRDGTVTYADIDLAVPAAADWRKLSYKLVPPANVVSMTVLHLIEGVGTLTTDMFTLTAPSAPTLPFNLIRNGDMEVANGVDPANWTRAGYGNNTRTYTYPIVGHDGGKAVQISISNYVDGDGKYTPEAVPMQYGKEYTFSAWYKGTTITDVIGEYILSNGLDHHFGVIKELPPTAEWTFFSAKFTPPNTAVSFKPLHLMSTNGTFAIDDVSLTITGNATSTNDLTPPVGQITSPAAGTTVSGTVTIQGQSSDNEALAYVMLAIDGTPVTGKLTQGPYSYVWDTTKYSKGAHVLKITSTDISGNNSASSIVVNVDNTGTPPPPTTNNLIANPSLETADIAGNPQSWLQGNWGTNTAVFSYPVAGQEGTKAAKITITAYTSGDAKWYFTPVAVTASSTYTFSNYYQSTVPSHVTIQYTKTDSTNSYVELGVLPPAAIWTQYSQAFTVPAGVASMTIFHYIDAVGSLTVDNYKLQ